MDDHPIKLFEGTVSTLSRSLDLRARQHEMILGNVANADTPGYQPFSIDVEKALQDDSTLPLSGHMVRTDSRHLPGLETAVTTAEEETGDANPLLLRGDGNNVDIDAEMTALSRNSMLYKASAQIIAAKFKGLKNVITGGK